MPRIRTIKPDFFKSLTIGDLSPTARLTFIGLWCYADDNGVAIDDARLIRAEIWPLDEAPEILQRIREDLTQIADAGLITRYFASGKRLLAMNSWDEHQRISHPKKPRFSRPEDLPEPPPEVREHDHSGESSETSGGSPEDYGGSPSRAHARVPCSTSTSLVPAPEEGGAGGGDESTDVDLFGEQGKQPPAKPKRKRKPKPEENSDFIEFWGHYPKKTSKSTAANAFAKAVADGADPRQIIEGARLYAQMWEGAAPEERQFITKASNWLNDGMWDGSWHMRDIHRADNVTQLRPAAARPSTTDQRVQAARDAARELQAEIDAGGIL